MGFMNSAKNIGKGVVDGVGKILTPPKQTKPVEQDPYHTRETVDDYALRIQKRRARRY
jgi:hypothetical protein